MKPKERAILALEGKQPDIVPHFELEMQLTQEYFGKSFVSEQEWKSEPSKASEYLKRDAELLIQTADYFDYCIILYSGIYRPSDEDYIEGIRMLKELDNDRHLTMAHGDSTISIPDGDRMESLSYELVDRASQVKAEQDWKVDDYLKKGERLLKAGIDGFILCNDYCFNSGPFLSPTMFSEFITPYLFRLVKGYRDLGAYVIKHTDGNIMPILDQVISTNPHGLHSLDSMAGVDIREVKKLYGDKVCLIGNVNCALMQTGTEQEITESCRYAMENGKPGGGYIFSTSNVIFKGMPKRSYDIMLDYYRNNNTY